MLITSGDLFKAALRKCGGVLAEGETPSAELMEDTRMAFNVMLDAWSAERLSVYNMQDQIFTWPAGYASRTLGPTGTLVGNRPIWIDESSYFRDTTVGLAYPIEIISQADYDGIALKTSTGTYPQYMVVGSDMPNATIYLYPIPTLALEFHFISVEELTQVNDLFTDIVFPPGYQRAFIFNLAVEICVELGLEAPPTTKKIATSSKRVLKAVNAPKDVLQIPVGLLSPAKFNIYSGE
jgi:hypothetical protein